MNTAKDCTFSVPVVSAAEYLYDLPAERIAVHPLPERDRSKLLVADIASGSIAHRSFTDLPDELPPGTLLVMNNTRVITARILMHKTSGGAAEVLCLSPVLPGPDPALALQSGSPCRWRCMIGGKRIRQGSELECEIVLPGEIPVTLRAHVLEREGAEALVEFSWQPASLSFAGILDMAGVLPLPPYLKREAEPDDIQRYQTVYAQPAGSVAAPTAGLHFTDAVLQQLRDKGIHTEYVTLHVGAGTFQPLQSDEVAEHRMHREYISVSRSTIEGLHRQCLQRERDPAAYPIVPVGTTSVRTLESLYWFGVRLALSDGNARSGVELELDQWDAYRLAASRTSALAALEVLLQWMDSHDLEEVTGGTRIIIVPGYTFALCDALVTNFHQPNSTLILLVAALMGKVLWRRVYDEALAHDYRFLSYGDSSLLRNF
jgi:S-adenosylmethionine:tRNA ribosyltransferase-isomerase